MGRAADKVPVIGFAAPSGTGKTTLLRAVLALLNERGLRVGVIKLARDDFDVDVPGKDSFELRKAGIEVTLVASDHQSALIVEHPGGNEPELNLLLAEFEADNLDLILVEGFSGQPIPRVELWRGGDGPLYLHDSLVIALATDRSPPGQPLVPVLDINDPLTVADFLTAYLSDSDSVREVDWK